MNIRIHYIAIFSLVLLLSCKGDNKPANNGNSDSNSQVNKERLEGLKQNRSGGNIASQRAQALSIVNFRLKNNPESYAIVEADVWQYQFIFDGEMTQADDGVWIDFKPDFTYDYGTFGEVQGSGRYSYHFERSELLIIDNDSSLKPQEWSVKSAGDAMILIGTATYQDNSIQMKLIRVGDAIRS